MTSSASSINDTNLVLALNNCEERLQAVLGEYSDHGCTAAAVQEWAVPGRTVRFMVPGIASMLSALGRDTSSIRRIACTRGPGSFTGIRLALSAAAGLAAGITEKVERVGIDYLPLLGRPVAQCSGCATWVLTHARRNQVYIQGFEAGTGRPVEDPASVVLEEAAEIIRSGPDKARILGTGVRNNHAFFAPLAEEPGGRLILEESFNTPRPDILLENAVQAAPAPDFPAPLYIRASDAEDNLEQIAAKRGMAPEKARRLLEEATSDDITS